MTPCGLCNHNMACLQRSICRVCGFIMPDRALALQKQNERLRSLQIDGLRPSQLAILNECLTDAARTMQSMEKHLLNGGQLSDELFWSACSKLEEDVQGCIGATHGELL